MRIEHDVILTLRLPYRERLILQKTVFHGGSGPKVAVVSGLHGDELDGLYVCHRLAGWLEDLAATRPEALLGRVELYPAMNPLGLVTLSRLVPVFDTDLNRAFPGHPKGLLPQQIADALLRHLTGSALVIDIHSSNIFLREVPQVRIHKAYATSVLRLAQEMNIDIIWVHDSPTVMEATLSYSLNGRGIPCLVVEMGVGMRVNPPYTQQLVTGVLGTWRDLGVLAADLELPERSHTPLLADDRNVHYLNAPTSGLFIPVVEHWITVKKGERIGRIVSPRQGGDLSTIHSPVDGILFTLREYPLVYEGSLMARIMATEAVGKTP
ncbi:MAG: M14 family metallopeptidase [Candidatus Methylomirabilaceae bacterium]